MAGSLIERSSSQSQKGNHVALHHVMLDIETMGKKPYSAIIGIGAALFDPRGNTITDSIHVTIDLELAQKRGFRLDAGTVSWWLAPEQRPAWDAYLKIAHFDPDTAFLGFQMWLDESVGPRDEIAFWGNGAGFDCNLMHNAAELLNVTWRDKNGNEHPGFWPHWNDRCFRTMKSLMMTRPDTPVTAKSLQPKFEGTPHVAVDDAMHQARWLQAICNAFHLDL